MRSIIRLLIAACPALVLALATPAPAEIYRWVDAHGREHFTTELSQIPAAQRGQVEKAQGGSLNRAASSPGARTDPSSPQASGAGASAPSGSVADPAAQAEAPERILGKTEAEWRAELARLRTEIERFEQATERCGESAGVRLAPGAGRRAYDEEAREAESCDRTRQDLDHRRRTLTSLEERARSEGVPPGWLR